MTETTPRELIAEADLWKVPCGETPINEARLILDIAAALSAALANNARLREVIAEATVEVNSYGEDPEPEDGWRIVAYTSAILAKAVES